MNITPFWKENKKVYGPEKKNKKTISCELTAEL